MQKMDFMKMSVTIVLRSALDPFGVVQVKKDSSNKNNAEVGRRN